MRSQHCVESCTPSDSREPTTVESRFFDSALSAILALSVEGIGLSNPHHSDKRARRSGRIRRLRRREHERYEIEVDLTIEPKDAGSPQRVRARTANVSLGGAFIRCRRTFAIGSIIRVRLDLEQSSVWSTARVAHVSADGFGCAFVDMAAQSREALVEWLGRSGGVSAVGGTIELEPV